MAVIRNEDGKERENKEMKKGSEKEKRWYEIKKRKKARGKIQKAVK